MFLKRTGTRKMDRKSLKKLQLFEMFKKCPFLALKMRFMNRSLKDW